jgi:hypothetical protein
VAALIFDAGALIALERADRDAAEALKAAANDDIEAITSSACVAQVWRDPARQARLVHALRGFLEQSLDEHEARRCGLLLARAGTDDIADAAVALLAKDGDTILTSDPRDIERLLRVAGTSASVRPV